MIVPLVPTSARFSLSGQTLWPVIITIAVVCLLGFLGGQAHKLHAPGLDLGPADIASTKIQVNADGGADYAVHLNEGGLVRLHAWTSTHPGAITVVYNDRYLGEIDPQHVDNDILHFMETPAQASQDRFRIGK